MGLLLRLGIVGVFGATLVFVVLALPDAPGGLTQVVGAHMDLSGVEHPVTAVLLNFRGYDTWLEVTVLLLAVLSLMALQRIVDLRLVPVSAAAGTLLVWLARMLTPAAIAVGGYLLWLGTHAPGGAFQSGAVLAAALVLLRLAGFRSVAAVHGWALRGLLLLGFAGFLAVAIWRLLVDGRMLQLSPDWAGAVIVLVELGVAFATAMTLAGMFVGGRSLDETEGAR